MPKVCLIAGDGVGQEVIPAAARALGVACADLSFAEAEAGWGCFLRHGSALPESTRTAVATADATMFGATQSPSTVVGGYSSPILSLRRDFDLFANLRPSEGSTADGRRIDLLIVRENTEGLYSGREHREGDTAIAERVITRRASERIARVAFQEARRRALRRSTDSGSALLRPRCTIVHKANVLKLTDGLFRESCLRIAAEFSDVDCEEMLVDTTAMWLAKDPSRFDVIVTTNLFGDILSDLASGLVGGLGLAPGANIGYTASIFEAVHGSAPDIAGKNIANPAAIILAGVMMLRHLKEFAAADTIERAVRALVAEGKAVTRDLNPATPVGTREMADAIIARMMAG